MKVVVYTAIYGDYDQFKPIPVQTMPHDFFLFSDLGSVPGEYRHLTPRMQAKYFKLNPHILFPDYDIAIWVDGSAEIKSSDFVKKMVESLDQSNIMCFRHPEGRNCIYDEAVYCKDMPKYIGQPVLKQVESYKEDKYPPQNGLYACGLVVSRPKISEMKQLLGSWWRENLKWSYQDQLSLPYVSWKLKTPVKFLELNQYNNPYISFNTHLHKSLT